LEGKPTTDHNVWGLIVKVVILFILLLLSGFFSGSETALIGIGKVRARSLLRRRVKSAEAVQKLVNEPDALLTTVLIGNNLVNIAASAIATSIAIEYFGSYGVGIATGVMLFLILTFCEVIPKTIAVHHSERVSIIVSKPLEILTSIFRPIIKALAVITAAFGNILGMKMKEGSGMSEEEVKTMLDIGEEEGAIEDDEKEMMERVLKLNDTTVKEVMTPKKEMVGIEANKSVGNAVELVKRYGYSRIPVYAGTEENIVGILYAKDLLMHVKEYADTGTSVGSWGIKNLNLIKPPYFVNQGKRIDDLLKEFQKGNFHIAMVVDEEGRIKGLVTLEDLLEEIVGSIYDEYDLIKMKSKKEEPHSAM
jgi:Mg2+/Co2+ transporter CorB